MQDKYDRLEEFRIANELSNRQIADNVGLSEAAIRRGIKEKTLKEKYIRVICRKYNLSSEWLESGEGEMRASVVSQGEGGDYESLHEAYELLKLENDALRIEANTWKEKFQKAIEIAERYRKVAKS